MLLKTSREMPTEPFTIGKDLVLLGPTCSWKSETAIIAAEKLGAEIVSCDSMQVYQGLEIGTAQPNVNERRGLPHHLIGCMNIQQPYDVNIFLEQAKSIVADIHTRGRIALFTGGTGMYARAIVYGLSLLPAEPAILQKILAQMETLQGRKELEDIMTEAAGGRNNIPQDVLLNPRRFARASEVVAITGKTPWDLHPKNNSPNEQFQQFIIMPDFQMLKDRIRARTELMIKKGWIEEAQHAIGEGLMQTPTARQALGYRDIDDFFQGKSAAKNLAELTTILANRTIQYARRQITWFKHQHPGAHFLNATPCPNTPELIANEILKQYL